MKKLWGALFRARTVLMAGHWARAGAALALTAGLGSEAAVAEALRPMAGAQWVEASLAGGTLQARSLQACERFSRHVRLL